ncbi:MAG: PAS domain-containing sensor histidine kinase [Bacteroidetes bacterium]|nr:MAG: PAS domain-containing sensor histidine kinase [Bacteroidota bacterium]
MLDTNGIFLEYYSRSTSELLFSPSYFIGKDVREVLPPHITSQLFEIVNKLLNGEILHGSFEYELSINNKMLAFDASVTCFEMNENETAILVSIRDITKTVEDRNLLAEVMSSSSDGLMVAHAIRNDEDEIIDFRWRLANEAALAISGRTAEEVIGNRMLEVSEYSIRYGLFDKYKKLIETNQPFEQELEVQIAHQNLWVHINAYKLNDGFVVRFRDITREKIQSLEAQSNLLKQKLFIAQAPTAIAMLDNRMNYIACSAKWQSDYGLEGKNIIGKNHYIIFPEIGSEWKHIHQQCLQGKVRKSDRDSFKRLDGTMQWLRWEVRPWYELDGSIGGLLMFTEDITEQEHSREKLADLNLELQEANEQKNRLFSVLAHDLRGPFSGIYTMLDIIKTDYQNIEKSDLYDLIQHIHENAGNMQELLDDLLLWSKEQMGNSTFKASAMPIEEPVNQVIKSLNAIMEKKDITLAVDLEKADLYFDEGAFKVLVRNFITNAVKFSNPSSQVEIIGRIMGNKYSFHVIDHGIGMSEFTLKKLLQEETIESHWGTAGEKGSGIGLSICRSYIKKGNGKLDIDSKEGEGTTVSVQIPLA